MSVINRRVEYLSATIMVGWAGLLTVTSKNTITSSLAFAPLVSRGWTDFQLASILGLFGFVWLCALWVNGRYRRTPVLRCICAAGGVVIWSHVGLQLIISGFETGVWSTGLPVYWSLAIFDLASCYRSAADAYFAHIKGKMKDMAAHNEP